MESIFLDRKKAHDKLHEHPPTHIAVAYVGRDWNKLIDCSQLKEIIVSPTLGTTGNWIGIEILFTPSIGIWMFISIIAISCLVYFWTA